MKSKIKISLFVFLLLIPAWNNLHAFDSFKDFSKLTFDEDPGQPDTLYFTCIKVGATKQVIRIRFKTDNIAFGDSVIGAYIPFVITTDKPGVVLDSSLVSIYNGTSIASWNVRVVSIFTPAYPGDPSLFPMHLLIGGYDSFFDSISYPLGKGEYLMAKLVFTVSGPTKICVDTTSKFNIWSPLLIVTTAAAGYIPQWEGGCCEPTISLGDINEDHLIDLKDVVCLANYLFGKPVSCAPDPIEIADVNCDEKVFFSDVMTLVDYIFRDKPIPCY